MERFLSTLSLRRATHPSLCGIAQHIYFYPRSPCGERRQRRWLDSTHRRISIHALLAESDCVVSVQIGGNVYFYPRSPCGERRANSRTERPTQRISIHALLAESDLTSVVSSTGTMDFYPRSPCGERRKSNKLAGQKLVFLSTLSLRRATVNTYHRIFGGGISIHALLAESDIVHALKLADPVLFLSTLSLRRATVTVPAGTGSARDFYPRSPCGERQRNANCSCHSARPFLSTLSLRRATASQTNLPGKN